MSYYIMAVNFGEVVMFILKAQFISTDPEITVSIFYAHLSCLFYFSHLVCSYFLILIIESLACSDFGDCRHITSGAATGLEINNQLDPVKANGEQNPKLAPKKEENRFLKNHLMDNGESAFSKSMHSSNKGTENDASVNNCSVSISYGTCAPLSPVDACDMTRCVPSGSLPSDSLDSSPSSLGTTQPDGHIDLQQIPSGVDGYRLVLNEGVDVEMKHSQVAVQNELQSDISGTLVSQNEAGQRYLSKVFPSDSTHLPACESKLPCESDLHFNEKSEICTNNHAHVHDTDGSSHLDCDCFHTFTGKTKICAFCDNNPVIVVLWFTLCLKQFL